MQINKKDFNKLDRSENREGNKHQRWNEFFCKRKLNQSVKKDKEGGLLGILLKKEQNKDSKNAKKKKKEISLSLFFPPL